MNTPDVLPIIEEVATEVFGRPIQLSRATTARDIPEWDSLENFRFLVSVERRFGIKISGAEAASIQDIGELNDLVVQLTDGKLSNL